MISVATEVSLLRQRFPCRDRVPFWPCVATVEHVAIGLAWFGVATEFLYRDRVCVFGVATEQGLLVIVL